MCLLFVMCSAVSFRHIVCDCHWRQSCAAINSCAYAACVCACGSLRVCLHPVGLSVWFGGVDMGRPSGRRFNPACWRDRPEHRLKLKPKSNDWQQSKKEERPLETWHREPALLGPRRTHTHTHTRTGFSLAASYFSVCSLRGRER